MTSLTVELTPEVYHRLHAEAQRQGKAEHEVAQEILTGQLLATIQSEVPLYVRMLPQIRVLVEKRHADTLIVPGKSSAEETIAMLRAWTAAEPEDDEEDADSWEDVLRSIDEHRTSYRRLFADVEHSV